jgi:hypothetical protein
MRRLQDQESLADYFFRGGQVGRPPAPAPTDPSEILEYLADCSFTVYPAPRGEGQPKYVYQGQVITIDRLVSIANEHRAIRGLEPFEFGHQLH